ncbi:MAG: thiamine-phosphate kinase [Thaumarchaeota archaeon]|nr:thiamine-phosphate kinase [Nitrososphaerota archaeon]
MKKLDELEIIKIIQKELGNDKFIPEDVESFCVKNQNIIAKVDTLVQSTDMPPKMKLKDAARKSMVACVSDFVSKGVKPNYCIISLNLPKEMSRQDIIKIAQGLDCASKEFGVRILGGDINEGMEISFHVCMFGTAKNIVLRGGASPDELLFVSGPFGYSAAGLEILLGHAKSNRKFKIDATRSFARPTPRLEFALKSKRYLTSSMDSSDGLSVTLNEMARQSRCKFIISNIPTHDSVAKFARGNNISAEKLIFHGGEEYEFAFTIHERHRNAIQKNARDTKTPIFEIGCIKKGSGVFIAKDGNLKRLHDAGWHHFG